MDVSDLHAKAQQLLESGRLEEAYEACVRIVRDQPQYADAYFLLGIIAGEVGNGQKSALLIEKAISFDQCRAEYYAHYSKSLFLGARYGASKDALQRAVRLPDMNAQTCDTIGTLLCKFGRFGDAVDCFETAVGLRPGNENFHFNLGAARKALGDFAGAYESYEQAIALQPNHYAAFAARSEVGDADRAAARVDELRSVLEVHNHAVDAELMLCHALATEYARLEEHDVAFEYLHRGNTRKSLSLDYDADVEAKRFESMRSVRLPPAVSSRVSGKAPIFVVGMPRSGTTVVERILSNHSQVASAGELHVLPTVIREATGSGGKHLVPDNAGNSLKGIDLGFVGDEYLRGSRAFIHEDSPVFVDKFPLNFFYLSVISRAIPDAKVVCVLRDPLDVCFGNYKTLFSLGVPYYDYSFDLLNTARYIANFRRLLAVWTAQLDGQICTVDYERLVEAPQVESKKLFDFCGLPWEAECTDIGRNANAVATASAVQVRQPLNRDSVGRWKKYRSHLEGVRRFFDGHGA